MMDEPTNVVRKKLREDWEEYIDQRIQEKFENLD